MAIAVEEFVNPKSMITPGAAAALVATIAGALFSIFGLTLAASLISLSFFVGLVVFHSKEFSDPGMKQWAKGFFYVLNSFIIFAMATGTHAVLDKGERTPRGSVVTSLFIRAAHAESSQPVTPTLKQQRPFFYDWTKGSWGKVAAPEWKNNPIIFKAEKDFGPVKRFFVEVGLATPDYKVTVEIDKSKLPANARIKSVRWNLPHAYFDTDDLTLTDSTKNFALGIEAWRPFVIGAQIELESGETLRSDELITFSSREGK